MWIISIFIMYNISIIRESKVYNYLLKERYLTLSTTQQKVGDEKKTNFYDKLLNVKRNKSSI